MSGGLFGGLIKSVFGGSDTPEAPDYTPMANASKESAEIGAKLGREQLDENKRQYDLNMASAKPVIDAQAKQMQLSYDQGKQSYDTFQTEGRPIQQAMRDDAMGITSPTKQRIMDEAAGTAIADARSGTTQQMNQMFRTGARYGFSPAKLASMGTSAASMGAQSEVAAANGARTQAGDKYYAKLGDTVNSYAGMASSAPSFYQAGTSAGSSAIGAQTGISGQYMNGINQGNSTIMGGRSLYQGGLGGILNSQTSAYGSTLTAETAQRAQNFDLMGSGAAAAMKMFSDKRLKKNIVKLLDDVRGFGWYAYEYVWGGTRQVGVMAQEVQGIIPGAVSSVNGYLAVDYSAIKGAMT